METVILEILETAAITVRGFLIKKYVFLESDMEAKKQKFFYLVSFFLIGIVFLAFGKDIANMTALFLIGLNICLGRKKHRLCGLIQMLPFSGIINGLLVPTLLVPPYFFAMSAQETVIYQFILYGALAMLLWVIGILLLLFANHTTMQITVDSGNVRAADGIYGRGLAPFIGITSVSAFVMTMMIIGKNRTSGKKDMVKLHIGRKKKAYTIDYRIIKRNMQTSIPFFTIFINKACISASK